MAAAAYPADEDPTASDRLSALATAGPAPQTQESKRPRVEAASEPLAASVPSAASPIVQTQTLFAKNLAFSVTEEDLRAVMAQVRLSAMAVRFVCCRVDCTSHPLCNTSLAP